MKPFEWAGVMPAMLTPFSENHEIDAKYFIKNLNAQFAAGATAVVLAGSLGEVSTLTTEEKTHLLRLAVDWGKLPVIMNIAEQATTEAKAAAKTAESNGADGLMVLPPMRYKSTDRETLRYFEEIADSTSLPIMIYNNPVDYKIEVTLPMFEKLLLRDNIRAVKESTRDITNVTRLRNAFGHRLKIMTGVDTLALESLLAGADGWIAGLVDAFPNETTALYTLAKSGRIDSAVTLYRWFMPLLELDISPQLVQNIKLAASMVDLCTEFVRPPRLSLEGAERARVVHIVETALKSKPDIIV